MDLVADPVAVAMPPVTLTARGEHPTMRGRGPTTIAGARPPAPSHRRAAPIDGRLSPATPLAGRCRWTYGRTGPERRPPSGARDDRRGPCASPSAPRRGAAAPATAVSAASGSRGRRVGATATAAPCGDRHRAARDPHGDRQRDGSRDRRDVERLESTATAPAPGSSRIAPAVAAARIAKTVTTATTARPARTGKTARTTTEERTDRTTPRAALDRGSAADAFTSP